MNSTQHQNIVGFIWNIANKLRGPYRPPQYRRVMLPLVVLRRLDLVLAEYVRLSAKGMKDAALDKALSHVAVGGERMQPLYNVSPFTFQKLLGDPPNIANNLIAYIRGFSPRAQDIFDKFDFETEIVKLDEANRLYLVIQEFGSADIDLSPERINNLQMGYLFEELVRKFNEQANEEAGDHFTPREVIRLMVNLVFSGEEEVYKPGIYKSIYDPTAGTGGMLSVSEGFIKNQNPDANLQLFGQEYNPESYALCCSDLLIKDEPIDHLIYGGTLGVKEAKNKAGGFVPGDGHPDKQFHYMPANPPFGVEWKAEEDYVREEAAKASFNGRFGAGLPRINDGSLLFLQHMIAKRHPAPSAGGDGSKIAIVFNGSRYLRDQIELSISGADGLANNIPQSSVKAYRFLAPPLAEQQKLVSGLSTQLASMAKTELSVRNAIDKLKEYRSALITAAVTGQIDVRGISIPDSFQQEAA